MKHIIGKLILKIEYFINCKKIEYYRSLYKGNGKICSNVFLQNPENIYVGDSSFVNGGGYLFASPNAKIIIGNNCMVSQCVHLRTQYHNFMRTDIPMHDQGENEADIIIGNDVWIGFGAQIMAGITIPDGVIIGAGAIVTHDCEAYGVYTGVPAKLIKSRKKDI